MIIAYDNTIIQLILTIILFSLLDEQRALLQNTSQTHI